MVATWLEGGRIRNGSREASGESLCCLGESRGLSPGRRVRQVNREVEKDDRVRKRKGMQDLEQGGLLLPPEEESGKASLSRRPSADFSKTLLFGI